MIIHEAVCGSCNKREKAIAPDTFWTQWRIPIHWIDFKGNHFCSNKCLKVFVNELQD